LKALVGVDSELAVVVAAGVDAVEAGLVFEALALLAVPPPLELVAVFWLHAAAKTRASVMSVIVSAVLRRIFIFISSEPYPELVNTEREQSN
jgi:ribulose kinase